MEYLNSGINICSLDVYSELNDHAKRFQKKKYHLKHLIDQPGRFDQYTIQNAPLFYDYSKQRVDRPVIGLLLELARRTDALNRFADMAAGRPVNFTENRSARHMDARSEGNPDLVRVIDSIRRFVKKMNTNEIRSSSGLPFTDLVVVGIGGSYLGTEFVYQALRAGCPVMRPLHFLSNVDPDNFSEIVEKVNPETTLWIIVSKSYTTMETLANLQQVKAFLAENNLDPGKQVVSITAQGSPGDTGKKDILESFHMFDYIGGRYSVTSAVGVLPLALSFGCETIQAFLAGCRTMDQHVLTADPECNIPLMAALLSIWNSHFLSYPAQAVIPYSAALSKLAPHIQQVYMESLGKRATVNGSLASYPTGVIIFGEPGTNAQHSFFQLAHQGTGFPIDFIGVKKPGSAKIWAQYKGVSNHQELWANMLAQARALAVGQDNPDVHRFFPGNRPSSTIVLESLSGEDIGRLLSFYEARTVLEGFILQINPFDQFGVELGKKMAEGIRHQMAKRNQKPDHEVADHDPAVRFYLDNLFDCAG